MQNCVSDLYLLAFFRITFLELVTFLFNLGRKRAGVAGSHVTGHRADAYARCQTELFVDALKNVLVAHNSETDAPRQRRAEVAGLVDTRCGDVAGEQGAITGKQATLGDEVTVCVTYGDLVADTHHKRS